MSVAVRFPFTRQVKSGKIMAYKIKVRGIIGERRIRTFGKTAHIGYGAVCASRKEGKHRYDNDGA